MNQHWTYSNKHEGERCFILGNSPSLKDEPLHLLKGEKVFCVNRGYKALDFGLDHYDYYVISDPGSYEAYHKEIQQNSHGPRFYHDGILQLKEYRDGPQEECIPMPNIRDERHPRKHSIRHHFPNSYEEGWGFTRTVVLDCSILAYFMGFKEIYLLGADFTTVTGKNTHFYGTGFREQQHARWEEPAQRFDDTVALFYWKFISSGVTWKNLSRQFSHRVWMQTDRLENVLGEP